MDDIQLVPQANQRSFSNPNIHVVQPPYDVYPPIEFPEPNSLVIVICLMMYILTFKRRRNEDT